MFSLLCGRAIAQPALAGAGRPRGAPAPAAGPTRMRVSSRGAVRLAPALAQAPQRPTPPVMHAPTYVDPFSAIVAAEKSGETVQVKVKSLNKGGAVVTAGELRGFVPYNQLVGQAKGDLSYLIGQTLSAKVISIDEKNRNFVLSERKAQQSEAMKRINVTKIYKAVVTSVEDYGAFVEFVDMPGVAGLVHKSELSWDSFVSVDEVIKAGQVVTAKVIDLDVAKCRLGLSIKQTLPDPIKQTLDTLEWLPARSVPIEMQAVMDKLKQIDGVDDVTVGRQATEAHIASQELVVYLNKDDSSDGFSLVARLGNTLQELYIITRLSREEMRGRVSNAMQAR